MSHWTYVHGTIVVDTFGRTDAESLYLAQTVINHLPRVSGSEGDVEYYVNLAKGDNCSSSIDELSQYSNLCGTYLHSLFKFQSEVIITLKGDLRDRRFGWTLRETTNMLNRLSSRLWVRECLVRVKDEGTRSFIFDNPDWIYHHECSDWIDRVRPRYDLDEEGSNL